MGMSQNIFPAIVGVDSPARRKNSVLRVVDIPILEEKEVGASVASRLRPILIAIEYEVVNSVLTHLSRQIVLNYVIRTDTASTGYNNTMKRVYVRMVKMCYSV